MSKTQTEAEFEAFIAARVAERDIPVQLGTVEIVHYTCGYGYNLGDTKGVTCGSLGEAVASAREDFPFAAMPEEVVCIHPCCDRC